MLRSQFTAKHYQYNTKSWGVPKAIAAAKKYLETGHIFVKRLDIVGFFDNFSHDRLLAGQLPLQKSVIKSVIIGKYLNIAKTETLLNNEAQTVPENDLQSALLQDAQQLLSNQGIPQGSAASPIVADFFLSKLDLSLPKGVAVINFVDDFLLLSKSSERIMKAENALESALAGVPVGTFELVEKSTSSSSSFEFLGHQFDLSSDGTCSVKISSANLNKFEENYGRSFLEVQEILIKQNFEISTDVFEKIIETVNYIMSWRKTFGSVDNPSELEKFCQSYIDPICGLAHLDVAATQYAAKRLGLKFIENYS